MMNYNPKTIKHLSFLTKLDTAEKIIPSEAGTMTELATNFCRDLLEMDFDLLEKDEKAALAQKITGLYALHLANICAVNEFPSQNLHAFSSLILYARSQLIGNDDLFEKR